MVAPICPTICSPGAGGGAYSATKISNAVAFAAPGVVGGFVDFDTVEFDVGPAITPDLAGDALVVEQDGIYSILATHTWVGETGSTDTVSIYVNGILVQLDAAENPGVAGSIRAGSLSVLVELEAGSVVQLQAQSIGPGGDSVLATLSAEKRN